MIVRLFLQVVFKQGPQTPADHWAAVSRSDWTVDSGHIMTGLLFTMASNKSKTTKGKNDRIEFIPFSQGVLICALLLLISLRR